MPKRIIDGDKLYTSDKITKVSKKYRAEYAWIIGMGLANGVCEASPKLVHHIAYSYNREDITVEDVARMLDEFEAAEMLVRYEVNGKTWMYFVGCESCLPPPSVAAKMKKGPTPPLELVRRTSTQPLDNGKPLCETGLGLGLGLGTKCMDEFAEPTEGRVAFEIGEDLVNDRR